MPILSPTELYPLEMLDYSLGTSSYELVTDASTTAGTASSSKTLPFFLSRPLQQTHVITSRATTTAQAITTKIIAPVFGSAAGGVPFGTLIGSTIGGAVPFVLLLVGV